MTQITLRSRLLGLAVAAALVGGAAAGPAMARTDKRHRHHPARIALRLSDYMGDGYLVSPGIAMGRGSHTITAGGHEDYTSLAVHRAVDISGRPHVRLHLTHSQSGPIKLTAQLFDVTGTNGAAKAITDAVRVTESAADAARGPRSAASAWFGRVRWHLPRGHAVRLRIAYPAAIVQQVVNRDTVNVYYGALPGEYEGDNPEAMQEASVGGPDPSRLTVVVADPRAAFAEWA